MSKATTDLEEKDKVDDVWTKGTLRYISYMLKLSSRKAAFSDNLILISV